MITHLIIGIVQGIVEWIPVSSEGILVIIFRCCTSIGWQEAISIALLLHFGTAVSSVIYFRKEIVEMLKFRDWTQGTQKHLLSAIIISTFFTGISGIPIYITLTDMPSAYGYYLMIAIGVLIIITGVVQIRQITKTGKSIADLNIYEIIIFGLIQGLSILPGLSRSALTISFLLSRKLNVEESLRLSYLVSIPVSVGGGMLGLIGLGVSNVGINHIVGILAAFIVGLATIGLLMNVLKKIPMGIVAMLTGVIVIVSTLV